VASWGDIALARTWSSPSKRRVTFRARSHDVAEGSAAGPYRPSTGTSLGAAVLPDGSSATRLGKPADGGLAAARRPSADRPLRVLIVDDHALYTELLLRQLAPYEWIEVVGCAANGRDGVTLAAAASPDAILMDLDMPVLDGIEAIRRIRLRSDVPVLVLTASASAVDRDRALAAGALAILPKTIDPYVLAAELGSVLLARDVSAAVAQGA
jgi:CheY-like chemotaxis protein